VRQRLSAVSILGLILALVLATLGAPAASAHHRAGPCDFHQKDGETIQHFSKRHIRCAVNDFGPVPGGADRAICIAERESGLIPSAQSPTGEYLGLYQHKATAWPTRYATWTDPAWALPTSALSGRTNAIVTIRMVAAAGGWTDAGWSPHGC
jgi:hypothetical protein